MLILWIGNPRRHQCERHGVDNLAGAVCMLQDAKKRPALANQVDVVKGVRHDSVGPGEGQAQCEAEESFGKPRGSNERSRTASGHATARVSGADQQH